MSREALHESLSALLDDETTELELRRILAAQDQNAVRATWSRYQVARAVMHKELLEPRLDLAAAVSAALADEPAHRVKPVASRWQGLGRFAVAASVTLAVLAGVRLYNQDQITGVQMAQQVSQPMFTSPQVLGPAVLASYSQDAASVPAASRPPQAMGSRWHEQHVPGYLRQHARQASFAAPEGVLPFARSASLEGR